MTSTTPHHGQAPKIPTPLLYNTSNNHKILSNVSSPASYSEVSNSQRFTKFTNPLINYDYKCGHYLTIWDQLYPSLTISFIEVSRGIRKSPWFFSERYNDLLKTNFNVFNQKFASPLNLKLSEVDN